MAYYAPDVTEDDLEHDEALCDCGCGWVIQSDDPVYAGANGGYELAHDEMELGEAG